MWKENAFGVRRFWCIGYASAIWIPCRFDSATCRFCEIFQGKFSQEVFHLLWEDTWRKAFSWSDRNVRLLKRTFERFFVLLRTINYLTLGFCGLLAKFNNRKMSVFCYVKVIFLAKKERKNHQKLKERR